MLSHEVRQELIKRKCTALARVLDAVELSGEVVTQKQAGRMSGLSPWTIREAVRQAGEFLRDFSLYYSMPKYKEKSLKNSKRGIPEGRPPKTLYIPTLPELEKALGILSRTEVEVKAETAADYRAQVYAEKVRRRPGTYSRRELAEPIGVTTRTTQSYDKRARLEVVQNISREPLTMAKYDTLPENYKALIEARQAGKFRTTYLQTPDGQKFGYTQTGAQAAIKHAGSIEAVAIVTRKKSSYYPEKRETKKEAQPEQEWQILPAELYTPKPGSEPSWRRPFPREVIENAKRQYQQIYGEKNGHN